MMYLLLENKSIVLANHTAQALAKIAEYNKEKAEEILDKLIEKSPLFKKTTIGFIIEAVMRFKDYDELVPKVKEFVEPYLESDMKVVAQKAKRTIKLLEARA
jgi:5,10-methylene-tetrahydrofolate dehydrogenase/methenyl tetrahydrofolate cyclohydrolase